MSEPRRRDRLAAHLARERGAASPILAWQRAESLLRIFNLLLDLLEVTERSLWAGIGAMRDGNRLHDIGREVQLVAEAAGFSVVKEYVGHAIGTQMHEEPQVPNYWPGTPGTSVL